MRGLFDFAREPGFGAERLAKILLWQDRLDEALETGRSDEPIFSVFASNDRVSSWNREALERLQAMIRSLALGQQAPDFADLSQTLWILILDRSPGPSAVDSLAKLLEGKALDPAARPAEEELPTSWRPAFRYCRFASRGSEPGRFRRWSLRLRAKL